MKKTSLLIAGFLASAALAVSSLAQTRELHLFTWNDYIDPELVKTFEGQNGAKVKISIFDTNPDLISKLEAGGLGVYDVVIPTDYAIAEMLRKHLLRPLDRRKILNLKNLSDRFRSPSYDYANKFSAAYQWGTLGIAYRKDKIKNLEKTWGLLFNPKLQQGKFALYDAPREMIGSALLYLGKSMSSTDAADIARAAQIVSAAKTRSIGFLSGASIREKLLKGEIAAGILFNTDAGQLAAQNPNIGYFIPREGAQIYVDNMAVPVGAPNVELAHKFINFILEAQNGAKLSIYTKSGTPNAKSKLLLPQTDLKNSIIYPALDTKLEYIADVGDSESLYLEAWKKIKRP
jgi:spermidine/putrescine transport system substrate-binding protein